MKVILGTKKETTQRFTQDGGRIPVTRIKAGPCYVAQIKHKDNDGYDAIQLGYGEKEMTKVNKPRQGHFKGASLKKAPCFLQEVREEGISKKMKPGDRIKVEDVLQAGDEIKVTGWSKGKGFTGVMKRWGFKGGPRTHGQSDRQRAPGSIGQGTTPGRVHKGKKMPGRSGGDRVTVKGLTVMAVDEKTEELLIKGLVPGSKDGWLIISKVGKAKKIVPLMKKGEKKIEETGEQRAERLRREKEATEKLEEAKEVKEEKPAEKVDKGEENA